MPTRTHLVAVARRLKRELDGRAFLTIQRTNITDYLRQESGEPTTRIKSALAKELTSALGQPRGAGVPEFDRDDNR